MLNDILSRVARVGAMHTGNRPNPPAGRPKPGGGKPPTSPGKSIKHKSFLAALAGAVAGALVAAAVFAAAAAAVVAVVALTGLTGGMGLALVVGAVKLAIGFGAVMAAGDLIAKVSAATSSLFDSSPSFGPVATGSGNVFVEKKPVSRAEVDTVACTKHNSPQLIAQGSETVYVNEHPAARIDDQTVCGATIKDGASTVFFGSGKQTCLEIADEFSWWEKALLVAVEFLVPPSRGLIKGLGKLFIKGLGAVVKGAMAGAKFAVLRLSHRVACAGKALLKNKGLSRFKEAVKAFKKDPVYLASGEVIEQRTDLELGQTLPLIFERTYRSSSSHSGMLGKGWYDTWSEAATVSREGVEVTVAIALAAGYEVDFTFHQDQRLVYCPHYPEFSLERRPDGFHLWNRDTRTWRAFTVAQGDRHLISCISDPNGNRIDFLRDARGKLLQLRHSDGIELMLSWQGEYLYQVARTDSGRCISLLRYEQDSQGRLSEADAVHAYRLAYEYDRHNRLTRWYDYDKTWASYEYDAQGRCVFTTCADGIMTARFTYHDHRVVMVDGHGQRSEFLFNDLCLMSEEISPLGHVTRFEYDDYGNLLREISPAGRVTAFSYLEDTGLVSCFTDGSGYDWKYEHDDEQRLCGVTDPTGRSWRWSFDEPGNPEKLTGPDASEMHFTWNRYGLLTRINNQTGEVQARLHYDQRQRLLSTTDAEGRTQQLRYDRQDRLVQVQHADGARFQLGYRRESWKLPEQLMRPDGREEHQRYDRHNNLTSYKDGNGALWKQAYGAFDLMLSRTDAQGHTWRYAYDKESQQLTEVTAPDGSRWQWWLDADARVVRERDMAGTETAYQYDEDGLCIAVINGEGERREYLYDGRGLLLRDTAGGESTEYRYDAAGRLVAVLSPDSHIRLEYDLRDRVVCEWHNGQSVARTYHDDQRTIIRTLEWPQDEAEKGCTLTSTFSYSRTGDLALVQLPDGAELSLAYDAAGRESSRSAGQFAQYKEYNAMGWLTREVSGCEQVMLAREYRYDGAGNITAQRCNRDAQVMHLDSCGRVLSVLTGSPGLRTETAEQYCYARSGQPEEAGRLTQWQAGRLIRRDETHYSYDRAGRLIRRVETQDGYRPREWRYLWDCRSRLKGVITPAGERWQYCYDAFGRRISKSNGILETRFLWDGDQPAEIRHYRHGALAGRRHWVHNGWELLVQQRQTGATWETEFATSSQSGEPQALYGHDGALRWQVPKATLWGHRLADDASGIAPGQAFAGQYRDSESGLCYNRFRYYDPEGAQYISPDPLGLAGGHNPYSYVHNPLMWIDPLGLAACPVTKIIENAKNGKVRRGKDYHGRLGSEMEQQILSNPEGVYQGKNGNLTFHKDGNIVVTHGKGGAQGNVITSYGHSGPRGDSGAAIYGGLPSDPGLPVTPSMILNGEIPRPNGEFIPPAVRLEGF